MKSEPSTFSIDDLARKSSQQENWDGVRNYQVRNMMKNEMRIGDKAFFYHSSCEKPGIVGTVTIQAVGLVDPTAFDPKNPYFDPKSDRQNPRWYMCRVQLTEIFNCLISLADLRNTDKLKNMQILRPGNRLSITPITAQEWQIIHQLTC